MIFDFESDFAGSLRCIPMIARQKLDIVGIKLSLRQWSRFAREDRTALVDAAVETTDQRTAYREHVLSLIEQKADEPAKFLPEEDFSGWECSDQMPQAVLSQAASDAVAPPDPVAWAGLTPLQRFALIKLARSKHENENFVPAMREFGLLR